MQDSEIAIHHILRAYLKQGCAGDFTILSPGNCRLRVTYLQVSDHIVGLVAGNLALKIPVASLWPFTNQDAGFRIPEMSEAG